MSKQKRGHSGHSHGAAPHPGQDDNHPISANELAVAQRHTYECLHHIESVKHPDENLVYVRTKVRLAYKRFEEIEPTHVNTHGDTVVHVELKILHEIRELVEAAYQKLAHLSHPSPAVKARRDELHKIDATLIGLMGDHHPKHPNHKH